MLSDSDFSYGKSPNILFVRPYHDVSSQMSLPFKVRTRNSQTDLDPSSMHHAPSPHPELGKRAWENVVMKWAYVHSKLSANFLRFNSDLFLPRVIRRDPCRLHHLGRWMDRRRSLLASIIDDDDDERPLALLHLLQIDPLRFAARARKHVSNTPVSPRSDAGRCVR